MMNLSEALLAGQNMMAASSNLEKIILGDKLDPRVENALAHSVNALEQSGIYLKEAIDLYASLQNGHADG